MLKIVLSSLIFLVLFLIVNLFLCSPTGLAPEIVRVNTIKIIDFNHDSLKLSITAKSINKNDFEINIANLSLNIICEGDTIGEARRDDPFTIAPLDTADLVFIANLLTKNILKLSSKAEDSVALNFIGSAKSDLSIVNLPIGINLNYTFNLKENISETLKNDVEHHKIIAVKSAKLEELSWNESVVEIDFDIKNPYGLEIFIKNYPSKILINDYTAGEGNIAGEIFVQPKGKITNGLIVYELDNIKTIATLIGSIFNRKLEYETDGILSISILEYDITFPYSFKGELVRI